MEGYHYIKRKINAAARSAQKGYTKKAYNILTVTGFDQGSAASAGLLTGLGPWDFEHAAHRDCGITGELQGV
jgi:hypothetical protein